LTFGGSHSKIAATMATRGKTSKKQKPYNNNNNNKYLYISYT
jgi:hypothetical protein